jgi:hypothetical protein
MVKFVIKEGGGTMKKLVFALLCTIILTACGGNDGAPAGDVPENIFVGHTSYSFHEDGVFYNTGGLESMTMFVDFNSLQNVPVCPKPNCPHTDKNACSALGMGHSAPLFHNDKLYYILSKIEWNGGDMFNVSRIMTADVDGTNRRQVFKIEGMELELNSQTYVIADDVLYFAGSNYVVENNVSFYDKYYLFSFNLKTHEFNEVAVLVEGRGSHASVYGVFNNEIYINIGYPEGDYDLDDPTSVRNAFVFETKRYDFRTGRIYDSSLSPFAKATQERYIYTEDEQNFYAVLPDGKKLLLEGLKLSLDEYIDGEKCFNLRNGTGWDFTQNKLITLNSAFINDYENGEFSFSIIAKHKGDYIMKRGVITDIVSWHFPEEYDFIRVTEAELIKETTS